MVTEQPGPADGADPIAWVRAQLSPAESPEAEDEMVDRFVRATGGDLPHSAKRLKETLAWRRQRRPDLVVCTHCAKDPRAHYMHACGFDLGGCPVIYSCNGMALAKDYPSNEAHMINVFEHVVKLMPAGVEKWVWVLDFYKFGLADCNVRLARSFLDVTAAHYPERLAYFLIVDAPRVFATLWSAIEPYVDPKTRQKIQFLAYDPADPKSKLRAAVAAKFDPQMQAWLLNEMAENRNKKVAKEKAHSTRALHEVASTGHLADAATAGSASPASSVATDDSMARAASAPLTPTGEPAAGGAAPLPPSPGQYSVWGSSQLLARYHQQPDLLLPLAPAAAAT